MQLGLGIPSLACVGLVAHYEWTVFTRLSPPQKKAAATMGKLPVSICMISGAEAHRIERALQSIAEWAAEIVVVLNEKVNDGTEEIARRYGATIFREPWKGYVGQKNSAAEKATQPWLLGLDADEAVSEALREEIIRVLSTTDGGEGLAAYEFPRCTLYCGRWIRHGDWYPDRVLRLWKRGTAHWVGVEPHARLEVCGGVGRLRADLLHYSNESIAHQISKIAPYHAEFVRARVAAGKRSYLLELLARPCWRFLRAYLFRLGFLDGWQGFYIAALTSFSTLTRQAMVREAQTPKPSPP